MGCVGLCWPLSQRNLKGNSPSLQRKWSSTSRTMKKLGRSKLDKLDLVPINMKMTNFSGDATTALGILMADIIMGSKTLSLSFFVVDAKSTYSISLGRDWIHTSQCVPSTLHYMLMF